MDAMWASKFLDSLVRGQSFLNICASLEMTSLTASHLGEASFLPYNMDVVKVSSDCVLFESYL